MIEGEGGLCQERRRTSFALIGTKWIHDDQTP